MQTQSKTARFPTIPDAAIHQLLVAGREITFFGLDTPYRYEVDTSAELDAIWLRESDVVAECPSSVIDRFLRQSHDWQSVPEGVWLEGRVIKPVPFMEAVNFWFQRAEAGGDHWAAMVVRDLERLEELVFNVFHGIEISEDQQWTLAYRAFDGRPATVANDSRSLGPTMYQPSAMEREAMDHQRNRAAVA